MSVNLKMTAIADAIREKTGAAELLSLDGMAESIPQVFESGKEVMLKGLTNNYTRKYFNQTFTETDFSGVIFAKKIKPTSIYAFFQNYQGEYIPSGFDLSDVPTSTESGQWTFRNSPNLKLVPDINYPIQARYGGTWQGCPLLETIEIIRSDENTLYDNTFLGDWALRNVAFEGVIGQSISFDYSIRLTAESIKNIFEHLSDAATGMALTLATAAVTAAFGSTTAQEWLDLIATKTNWTISLV